LTPVAGPEARLLNDAADGRLDQLPLVEAALVAGGTVDEGELAGLTELFDARARSIAVQLAAASPPPDERPAVLFRLMHGNLLTGSYRSDVTVLDAALCRGEYNCVTATLLYAALCEREGIEVQIMATTGHVYCRLPGARPRDVEPTCPDWFDRPVSSIVEALRPAGSPVAGSLGASATRRSGQTQVISDVQLVARIYYNRGVALLEKEQFAEALALIDRSLQLDPHDIDARENLLAGINNWALAVGRTGDYRQATALVAEGLLLDPNYAPLRANDLHLHQRWVAQLCSEQQFETALEVLDKGRQRRPDAPLFATGDRAVRQAQERWQREN
jgi:tetratricopeptide (TPR) repeat protein